MGPRDRRGAGIPHPPGPATGPLPPRALGTRRRPHRVPSGAMSTPAAFFDLDRTLLRGASGPILTGALRSAGVISDRVVPGENLLYRLFNAVGGNRPALLLARQGARFSRGPTRPRGPPPRG